MDFSKYPTVIEQELFIRAYLDAMKGSGDGSGGSVIEVKQVMHEASIYSLASHLLWGLWGIVQAPKSEIDFDYLGYAKERFSRYFEQKREITLTHNV